MLRDDLVADGRRVTPHAWRRRSCLARGQVRDSVRLDRMLPGADGSSVCRNLRAFTTVPVAMLTARIEETDRLLDSIYVDHRVVGDGTVGSHIRNLCRKPADAKPGFDAIQSVCGVGYKLVLRAAGMTGATVPTVRGEKRIRPLPQRR